MKNSLLLTLAIIFTGNLLNAQTWKTYPYHQEGSLIYFSQDEGHHPGEPTEWWYLTGQVSGETSGNEYSFMLSYFYYPYAGFDGFRIFNLSNETDNVFYPETLPLLYSLMAQDSLHIETTPPGSLPEIWVNQTNSDGTMMPFQYLVEATQEHGSINIDLDTFKRPLMIADSGFLYQGLNNYTYYYIQTGITVSGEISFDGTTENIFGTGWIDHQYGDFNPYTGENYEWFSVQLSNGMDMNLWNIFTAENTIPDTTTYRMCSIYINENQDTAVSDFQLERLTFEFMPDSGACYSQKWHFLWNDMDLIITTNNKFNELTIPIRFYEGTTTIEGTVNGEEVTGVGFAELLHSYEIPVVEFISPDSGAVWVGDFIEPIVWENTNPDQGNPLFYDLSYSSDGGQSFNFIANQLTENEYSWDYSQFSTDYYVLKITAYSVDTTLDASYISDSVFIDVHIGISDEKTNQNIQFFPNPTDGFIHLKIDGEADQIEITDVNGIIVYQEKNIGKKNILINLSGQKSGIYFIHIKNTKGLLTNKLVLK